MKQPVTPRPPIAAEMLLPADPVERKNIPLTTGVLDYFPLALAEVARVSKAGNDQHNPGQPLHWARDKSLAHAACIGRHLVDRGSFDADGMRHSAKLAWRALALLQSEMECVLCALPAPAPARTVVTVKAGGNWADAARDAGLAGAAPLRKET